MAKRRSILVLSVLVAVAAAGAIPLGRRAWRSWERERRFRAADAGDRAVIAELLAGDDLAAIERIVPAIARLEAPYLRHDEIASLARLGSRATPAMVAALRDEGTLLDNRGMPTAPPWPRDLVLEHLVVHDPGFERTVAALEAAPEKHAGLMNGGAIAWLARKQGRRRLVGAAVRLLADEREFGWSAIIGPEGGHTLRVADEAGSVIEQLIGSDAIGLDEADLRVGEDWSTEAWDARNAALAAWWAAGGELRPRPADEGFIILHVVPESVTARQIGFHVLWAREVLREARPGGGAGLDLFDGGGPRFGPEAASLHHHTKVKRLLLGPLRPGRHVVRIYDSNVGRMLDLEIDVAAGETVEREIGY